MSRSSKKVCEAEPNAYAAFARKKVIEQASNKTGLEGSQAAKCPFHEGPTVFTRNSSFLFLSKPPRKFSQTTASISSFVSFFVGFEKLFFLSSETRRLDWR